MRPLGGRRSEESLRVTEATVPSVNAALGGLQVASGSLGEHIKQLVGAPGGGGESAAVALLRFACGGLRFVRGHPVKFAAGDNVASSSPTAWARGLA